MPRAIGVYEKTGNDQLNRFEFLNDDLDFFRSLFNNPDDDPLMYDAYKICERENEAILSRFGIMFDIEKFDCYLEYYE